jgi:hypothetical protein
LITVTEASRHSADQATLFDLVRCAYKGAPYYRLLLNGKWTGYRGSVDELKGTVEWIIAGRIITELAMSQTEPGLSPHGRAR